MTFIMSSESKPSCSSVVLGILNILFFLSRFWISWNSCQDFGKISYQKIKIFSLIFEKTGQEITWITAHRAKKQTVEYFQCRTNYWDRCTIRLPLSTSGSIRSWNWILDSTPETWTTILGWDLQLLRNQKTHPDSVSHLSLNYLLKNVQTIFWLIFILIRNIGRPLGN